MNNMTNLTIVDKGLLLVVTDKKTLEQASDIRSQAKKYLKDLTAEKEKVTKPLNDALKAERARFKPLEEKAEKVIKYLDRQMTEYQTAEAAKAEAAKEKIAARIGDGKGKLQIETAMNQISNVETPDEVIGNTQFVTAYELIVTDIKAIPDEYLKIEVRTLALTQALKAGTVVPGAELREVKKPKYVS